MISNERSWPGLRRPAYQPSRQPYYDRPAPRVPRPPIQEDTLATQQIQIERKHFSFSLKENPRGRFLRISEEVAGRYNHVIIPATGLREFQKLLAEMVNADERTPAQANSESQPPQADGSSL